jgi:phosphopantetheinyl transferase (holo-ACP synthase)
MIFSPWAGRAVIVRDIEDPQSWFDKEELTVIRAFARMQRQREWMLSRIAEKELRRNGVSGDYVSFSHSGEYGAAAIDQQPVGIDIEKIREISEAGAHLFLTGDEIAVMQRCRIEHRMLHFWSAKEALWKQRGGSVPTLRRVPLTLESESAAGLRFQGVETVAIGDLVAAITLPTS